MIPIRNVHEFVKENANILEQKVNTHPIHEENFVKWIQNHSQKYQAAASKFRENTLHVSFDEFKGMLGRICAEIRIKIIQEQEKKYKNIVLLLPDLLKKSNFWTSLYIFHLLSDVITHVATKIDQTAFIDSEKERTLIIIPDDASYTGKQIIIYASTKTSHELLFAIPYISQDAMKNIQRSLSDSAHKILFCNSSASFKKLKKRYTIYFDHKLADEVSTYQLSYALGRDEVTGDPEFVYEPMSLIQGCELYLQVDNPEKLETDDILKVVGAEQMCPSPFYKNIQYMFRGKPIDDLSTIYE